MGEARQALHDALLPLELDVLLWPPPVPTPGHAWPQWVMTEIAGYCAFTHTFEVWIAVGGSDPASTAELADTLIESAADALAAVGSVVQLEPVLLTLTDNPNGLPCIRIRVQTS